MENHLTDSYRYTKVSLKDLLTKSYHIKTGNTIFKSTTVGELVDEAADECGDQMAFTSVQQGISKTFSEFRDEVRQLACGFVSLGLKKGDRIAICCPNSYEWPLVYFAAAKVGLILVSLNPAYQASEIECCINKTACKALVIWDKLKTQDFYEILCKIAPDLPEYQPGNLFCSKVPNLKIVMMLTDEAMKGVMRFKDVLKAGNERCGKSLAEIENSVQFDDPYSVIFTSGTTGEPKGALLVHHGAINNVLIFSKTLFHGQKPVLCCQVPCFHSFGSIIGLLLATMLRYHCVFPHLLYSPGATLEAIEKYQGTLILGTPTMYIDMLNEYRSGSYIIDSLKQVVMCGSSISANIIRDIHLKLKVPYITEAYGMTESGPVIASRTIDNQRNDYKSGLTLLEYTEVKIINEDGNVVSVNTVGELCARSCTVFPGYWDDKEKTDEILDKARWCHTGDLAEMDEHGNIRIISRLKDVIIRGGANIYPKEIESTLSAHPSIAEVQVVGVPDMRMGEEVCACVMLNANETLSENDLKQFCKGKISYFKIPSYVFFLNEFPITASGKIKKTELRKLAAVKFNL